MIVAGPRFDKEQGAQAGGHERSVATSLASLSVERFQEVLNRGLIKQCVNLLSDFQPGVMLCAGLAAVAR